MATLNIWDPIWGARAKILKSPDLGYHLYCVQADRRRRRVRTDTKITPLAVPDHNQNVPKGVRGQVLFKFSLNLIGKWLPDVHGAHHGVGSVGGSGP